MFTPPVGNSTQAVSTAMNLKGPANYRLVFLLKNFPLFPTPKKESVSLERGAN